MGPVTGLARERGHAVADDSNNGGGNGNNGGGSSGGGSRSFTEADVERIVRDRLDRDRRKQEDALRNAQDSSKSDIDKLTAAVTALTERAAKAEAAVARRDAAEKYNLPKNIAAKLAGSEAEELDREARDWVTQLAELGVPVKDGKIVAKQGDSSGGSSGNGGDNAGGNADGSGKQGGDAGGGDGKDGGGQGSTGGDGAGAGKNTGNGGSGTQDSGGDAGKGKSLLGGRPTETLRSGAAPAGGGGEVDAGKLAESILGAGF
jgi:hypothetical protein